MAALRHAGDTAGRSAHRAARAARRRLLSVRRDARRSTASLISDCASWPDAAPPPPARAPLPNVPTLILSGEQDLRTPTANARAVAARDPRRTAARRPVHRPLGAGQRLQRLRRAGGAGVLRRRRRCSRARPPRTPSPPTPITPTRLSYIHPPSGLAGSAGQTLTAVLDTILDLNRQVVGATLQADAELPLGSSFGGLRGGYAQLDALGGGAARLLVRAGRAVERHLPGLRTIGCRRPRSASRARRRRPARSGSAPARRSAARSAAGALT